MTDRATAATLEHFGKALDKQIRPRPLKVEPDVPSETSGEDFTDAAHAERFAQAYGGQVRYHFRRERWLFYAAPIWHPDADGHIYRLALAFVRSRQVSALDIGDRKLKQDAMRFALQSESKAALDRLVGLAKNFKPLADAGDGWDADPWLLAAPNGVIDLRTGELRPGDPADRLTMSTRVAYDLSAAAPRWEQFLVEVFDADAELIGFVQRFIGYCLTGLTTEQVLAVLYGRGANGKSTFLNILRYLLGDYAHNLPFSTVELKQRAAIPNDLAALDGKRFVTASETNDGMRLNEARIKALTGCDPISARFMHSEWFTFSPVAKFALAVNHKPVVHDDSLGFWRRMRLVPFVRSFDGSARDGRLEETLRAEGAGILRWAVLGCLAWQQHGLGHPTAVREATDEYQLDSDPLAEFLGEACEVDAAAATRASVLLEHYGKWADRARLSRTERLSSKDFGRRMFERFPRRHTMHGKVYQGVKPSTGLLW